MEKIGLIKKLAKTINVIAWVHLISIVILITIAIKEELMPALIIALTLSGLIGFILLITFGKAIELMIDIRSNQINSNTDRVNIKPATKQELNVGFEQDTIPEKEIETIEHSTDNLLALNSLIQSQKRKLWGSSQKSEIIAMLKGLATSKSSAERLIIEYKNQFDKYLIDDIKGISSNYDTIRDYLDTFIELNIVSETYPHDKLN